MALSERASAPAAASAADMRDTSASSVTICVVEAGGGAHDECVSMMGRGDCIHEEG
jgi:hypothetical protein